MKKKLNVHIYPTSLVYETRIEKITESIGRVNAFNEIWVIGLSGKGLAEFENKNNNVRFIRININQKFNGIIGKLLKFIVFYYKTIRLLKNEEVICINAHSLSVLPLALYFKKTKKTKLVYDTHELETETPSLSGVRRKFAQITERLLIKQADKIFCVGEKIADWYEKKYLLPRPTVVLNSPPYKQINKNSYLRERLKLKKDTTICLYFGLLEPYRGIEHLLESSLILEKENIALVFIGYGSLANKIISCQNLSENIFLLQPLSQDELLHVAASADIGLCLIEPKSTSYNYCMPNKLFEYMAAGLPIVAGPCESLIEFFDKNEIGVIADKINSNEIFDSIIKVKLTISEEMSSKIQKVFEKISWQEESKKIIEYYSLFNNK